jgi:hypothetical protein
MGRGKEGGGSNRVNKLKSALLHRNSVCDAHSGEALDGRAVSFVVLRSGTSRDRDGRL